MAIVIRLITTAIAAQAVSNFLNSGSYPRVSIEQGVLKGIESKSYRGKSFFSFQGIPYAAPPLGDLRFKSPQDPPHWRGERGAWLQGNDCPHMHFIFDSYAGHEDCLYLNVYTSRLQNKRRGLDVMVFFHGGGFYAGSGNTEVYGPSYLLDHDVVLVTINYRLGAIGFLNLGTKDAPGNYGLKDQVAALRWVHKNIAKFGGNPKSITVFGQSAGGASINYLMLSPVGKGLFHRAIIHSGSAVANWAMQRKAVSQGREMAARLGCTQIDTAALIACLRRVNARDFAEIEIKLRSENKQFTYFTPTVEPAGTEDAIITEDPVRTMERGDIHCVPFIAGYTTREGLMMLGMMKEKGRNVTYDLYNSRHFVPAEMELPEDSVEFANVWHNISSFYERLEPNDIKERYLLLSTDADFSRGVDELVRIAAAMCKQPVYYYTFAYEGTLSLMKKIYRIDNLKGASHVDDIGYLFSRARVTDRLEYPNAVDFLIIKHLTTMWTNFARTGNPTPDSSLGVKWDPVMAPSRKPSLAYTRHLYIDAMPKMMDEIMNAERLAFWHNLVADYRQ